MDMQLFYWYYIDCLLIELFCIILLIKMDVNMELIFIIISLFGKDDI